MVIITGAGHGPGRCHALAFAARDGVNDLGISASGDGTDAQAADQVVAAATAQEAIATMLTNLQHH